MGLLDRLANWWILRRLHQEQAASPFPNGRWRKFIDIDGPTEDRLGPDGQVGHFFAAQGLFLMRVGLCKEVVFRTPVFRGKTKDEVVQAIRSFSPD